MAHWNMFFRKLTLQDLKSRSELLEVLKTMFQKYLLRLVILGLYHSSPDVTWSVGGNPGRLEEKVENPSDDFEQLIHDSFKFIQFDKHEVRTKKAKMLIHFQWLCCKHSSVMYRCYMPAFVAIASGSRRYPNIIAAIKKFQEESMLPIMDIDSSNVNSRIEILEIPENLEIYDSDTGRMFLSMFTEDKSVDTEETDKKEDVEAAHREEQEVSNAGV
ncbi:hypothetical protein K435DRAFT_777078 [Dendrothele bispora CBS 962.96]|uniref:Uncharacterized protein n=1 Tax=Dendrothele bispora (strain CBS 962.96) TaxID=1314807 RepID=A0A4S8M9V0_DENBC|nr:hypothetical protein K435DRAFT_777078 [Dendrothele bispora CBS 962.96]